MAGIQHRLPASAIQSFLNDRKREKREVQSAERDRKRCRGT
jgi:hypothetical protein